MSGLPLPTTTLISRLRRAAEGQRRHADRVQSWLMPDGDDVAIRLRAWANTCDQAAGRLEDLLHDRGRDLVPTPAETREEE